MSSEKPAHEQTTDSNTMLKELQSWWEIASIAQYISLFRESFSLPEIEIEELEKGLLDDSTEGPNSWLRNLILSLLRSYMPGRVNVDNWETQLQKLVNRKWPPDKEKPFPEDKSFVQLSLRTKVEIIYALCVYRLDRNDITEVMKSTDADALRVQKLGIDDLGNTYWYFYGTRLYKEESCKDEKSWDVEWKKQKKQALKKRGRGRPRKIQKVMKSDGESDDFEDGYSKNSGYMNANAKSRWSVVCDTIEEWVSLAEKFKTSKSKNEKALFMIIQENFLPTLNKIYEEKEKKLQQKLRELMPVREKIVTRRETRKQRGDTIESPVVNGYSCDNDEPYKLHMIKDRARRLEERQKRASAVGLNETQKRKRNKYPESETNKNYNSEQGTESDSQDNEYNYAFIPNIDGQKIDLQTQMERLMTAVKLHKDAWPFQFAVNEEDAPGYYEIIKNPIDLSTIDTRLHNGDYETVGELDADFSQMVSNCQLYNGEHHDFSVMVQTLWKMFRKGVSKILDSFPTVESSNDGVSDENSSSSSNSNLLLKSPHIRSHKKPKDGKKKKKKRGMEALEILAQASKLAIQNTNSNDMPIESNMYDDQKKLNAFPNLKVSTTNSHPPSLIEKFSSDSSNESSHDISYSSYSSYLNEPISVNEQYTQSSPNEVTTTNEATSGNLAHLASFIQKNNAKSLNILSNNDVTNLLSESSSSHENSNSSIEGFTRESSNSDNLDHGLDNMLDNENVSNIISQIIKQPIYNSDTQLISQSRDVNSDSLIESLSKQDNPVNKRKSPQSSLSNAVNYTSTVGESFLPGIVTTQSDLKCSPHNMTTIDASVIGIAPYNAQPKNSNMSTNRNPVLFASNESALPNLGHDNRVPLNTSPYQPQMSPNELLTNQYYGSSELENSSPTVSLPNVSYQSFDIPMSVASNQTAFIPTNVSSTSSMPLQVPATYPASVQHHQQMKKQKQNNLVRVAVPQPGGRVMVVSEANTRSGITYHVYTQAKSDQNENFANFAPCSVPSAVRVSPNLENRAFNNQENVVNRTPPSKKRSVPQQFQTSPRQVPAKTLPCYAPASPTSSTITKTTLPVTSSNFIPVNTIGRNKPSIIRTKASETSQVDNATTFSANSNVNQPYTNSVQNNSIMHPKVTPKTVPIVFSGYGQPSAADQKDMRLKNNQGSAVTMQLPNGIPVVQQLLFPGGQQPIQLPNGGQFVFTSPQNHVNRVFSSNQIPQTQNSIRQLNQGFMKVMPQMVTQAPIMQLSTEGMQGLQFQAVAQNGSQTFTQVAQTPQFVNIPTYMITNQNQVQGATPQMMNMQQFQQLTQRRQMTMNGEGNG